MLENQVTGFIADCKVAGFSAKSIESLSLSLREFMTFLQPFALASFAQIEYRHLADFVADFRSPSIHKKKARIWALHLFFHYVTFHGLIQKNLALDLPYPRIEKTVPQFLTVSEFNRLLDHFVQKADSPMGLQNLALLLMLGLLGLRTGTIVALNVEHVDVRSGVVWVQEKGGRERLMPLPELLCRVLETHLAECGHAEGPLFLSPRNQRIYPHCLQDILRSAAASVGIDKPLYPRVFRHTAATYLNKAAGTIIAQSVLGHARRQNTLKYAPLNPDIYADYMRRHPFVQEAPSC